jgi:UDP-galactopyranose mutase
VRGIIDDKLLPIPVNLETVNTLFDPDITNAQQMKEWLSKEQIAALNPANSEEVALSRVGKRLYELIFKPSTYKQWAMYPKELGPEVLSRIPVRDDFEVRYFSDPFQALPVDSYTSIFEQMLSSPFVTVKKIPTISKSNLTCRINAVVSTFQDRLMLFCRHRMAQTRIPISGL